MPPTTTALDSVWQAQRKWSTVANAAGKHISTWRRRNLLLLVTGALLGALAAQKWLPGGWDTGLAGASALVLAGAAWIQGTMLGKDRAEAQTVARAASEALKAATFWYLSGVAPYDGADRDALLTGALTTVDTAAASYQGTYTLASGDGSPTPAVTDVNGYVTHRAEQQRKWHTTRIAEHTKSATRFRAAERIATLAAAALGAVAALSPIDLEAWIGLFTTVGATIGAHLLAAQYEKLAASYGITTTKLVRLIDGRAQSTPTPESDATFVRAVEEVLDKQNEGWVALLTT